MSIPQKLRTCTSIDELSVWLGYYNGFVREAALRRAAELASPQLLPAILERLNDWVPQVRALAQAVLLDMLPSIGTFDAMRLLPAVQRLRTAGRADHSAWIASFERALVEKAGPQAIVDGLLDPDVRLARACWQVAAAARLAPPEAVIARLLPATRDIVLARQAVDAIFRLPEAARAPLFRRALESSFGMVRAIALRPLLNEASAINDALAMRMALDLQTWVRLIASAYLARRGIDVAAMFADALIAPGASSQVLRACLAGLAEQGSAGRLELVRSFTNHSMARVQLSANLACLRLAPGARDEIALEVLRSPHRRVRKLVLQLRREEGVYLDTDTALALMAAHDDVDMMFAFARHDPWTWLALIVQMEPRSHQDPGLRARLERELEARFASATGSYVKPAPAQRSLFTDEGTVKALASLSPMDEGTMSGRLQFELGKG